MKADYKRSYDDSLGRDLGMGAVRSALSRLLRSQDLVGWSTREENGRLDRRAFKRLAMGEASVFSRRQYKEAEKSAVSVLVDCSGSMQCYGRIETAQDVVVHLSQLLDRAKVTFTVNGFRTSFSDGTLSRVQEEWKLIPFKPWGMPFRKASLRLGAMQYMASCSTPDYQALYYSVEELSQRPESRRILFVITDAAGYNKAQIQLIHDLAAKHNIKVIAVGVNASDDLQDVFPLSANVSATDLAGATFKTLLKGVKQ